jgi:hypothetical protein
MEELDALETVARACGFRPPELGETAAQYRLALMLAPLEQITPVDHGNTRI